MSKDLIQISYYDRDLHGKELWTSSSVKARKEAVVEDVITRERHHLESMIMKGKEPTRSVRIKSKGPSKNMRYIRLFTFKVMPTTTIQQLLQLSEILKRDHHIECFQIMLDRSHQTAKMLFDYYDRENGKCTYLNKTKKEHIFAFIYTFLKLEIVPSESLQVANLLKMEFKENPAVFKEILEVLKYKNMSKHNYYLLRLMTAFAELFCERKVK